MLVPSERRGFGVVFQDYGLWPHLNVRDHVALVMRARRHRADSSADGPRATEMEIDRILQLVRLQDRALARPGQLSGGQQQRLAVARAIGSRPTLLLLDEPFSALDRQLRDEMRYELIPLLRERGITMVHVTHDQQEALGLSDRVLVLRAGRVEQFGSPEQVYRCPRTAFVAAFMGGRCAVSLHVEQCGPAVVSVPELGVHHLRLDFASTAVVPDLLREVGVHTVFVGSTEVRVVDGQTQTAPDPEVYLPIAARVVSVQYQGRGYECVLCVDGTLTSLRAYVDHRIAPGSQVSAQVRLSVVPSFVASAHAIRGDETRDVQPA